jgi:hypothetical protein
MSESRTCGIYGGCFSVVAKMHYQKGEIERLQAENDRLNTVRLELQAEVASLTKEVADYQRWYESDKKEIGRLLEIIAYYEAATPQSLHKKVRAIAKAEANETQTNVRRQK